MYNKHRNVLFHEVAYTRVNPFDTEINIQHTHILHAFQFKVNTTYTYLTYSIFSYAKQKIKWLLKFMKHLDPQLD